MEKKDLFQSFYSEYQQALGEIESHHTFPEYFYDLFLAGDSSIYQKNITETKTFDEEWIRTVESYFPSINNIVLNPKSVLKYEEEVVAVEKAKKFNSQSVKHLAANTHYIKEINQGNVIPKKILTTYAEIEYGTYENRMVMTLIDKLFLFVRHRYEIIKNNVESFQKRRFHLESKFPMLNQEVNLSIDLTIKEDLENKSVNEYNQNLLKRVEHLDKLVASLKTSQFMQKMEGQKKVYPPIIKSNIIMKNVDYKNAYMLWLFLDRYNTLAFDVDIKEKDLTFDEAYLKEIYQTALINYAVVAYNQENRKPLYDLIKDKKYKRRGLRVIKRAESDLLLNPDPYEVEDTTINQYYLEKFKSFFKKSLEYHESQSKTYETSLKRALRETLKITNTLYDSFFELNEDEDIFKRLVKDQDPVVELKDAKEKALIAKMIREVKEVDYREAVNQERRLLNKIAKLDQKLIQASKDNKLLTSKKIKSIEKLKKDKEKAKKQESYLNQKLKLTKKLDEELKVLKQKIYQDIQVLQKELKIEEEKTIKSFEKELNKKYKEELKKVNESYEKAINSIYDKLKLKKSKLKDSKKEQEQKLKKESNKNINKKKEALKVQYELKLAASKSKFKVPLWVKRLGKIKELKPNSFEIDYMKFSTDELKDILIDENLPFSRLNKKEMIEKIQSLGYKAYQEMIDLKKLSVNELKVIAETYGLTNIKQYKKIELIKILEDIGMKEKHV